jgi:hypothetical protein
MVFYWQQAQRFNANRLIFNYALRFFSYTDTGENIAKM